MNKNISLAFGLVFSLVLAACKSSPSTSPTKASGTSQQSVSYGAIVEQGERYMFIDREGELFRFIVCKLNNESVLVVALDWDIDFGVIDGF